MTGRLCIVLRVAPEQGCVRAALAEHLRHPHHDILVVFPSDHLPDTPWPELADARVRVAFAPPRRKRAPLACSVSPINQALAPAQTQATLLTGAAHA